MKYTALKMNKNGLLSQTKSKVKEARYKGKHTV